MPPVDSTCASTSGEKPPSVRSVTVRSTVLEAASMVAWNAASMLGTRMFMPKMTSTPNVTASVVRNERSRRPLR